MINKAILYIRLVCAIKSESKICMQNPSMYKMKHRKSKMFQILNMWRNILCGDQWQSFCGRIYNENNMELPFKLHNIYLPSGKGNTIL